MPYFILSSNSIQKIKHEKTLLVFIIFQIRCSARIPQTTVKKMRQFKMLMLVGSVFMFGTLKAQDVAPQPPVAETKKVEVKNDDKMKTLFSGLNSPKSKLRYIGLSFQPEAMATKLASEGTGIAGGTAMLHLNRKWGIGLSGYSNDRRFAPKALSSTNALALNTAFGGLKLEYTPNPNALIHVSFPLLIGGGMAQVDSLKNQTSKNGRDGRDNWGRGNNNFRNNGSSFFVVQPGINIEANVLRYAKVFVGASYRIVGGVTKENSTTTSVLPSPTASQLSGVNLNFGMKVGLFDYDLQRPRTSRKEKRMKRGKA